MNYSAVSCIDFYEHIMNQNPDCQVRVNPGCQDDVEEARFRSYVCEQSQIPMQGTWSRNGVQVNMPESEFVSLWFETGARRQKKEFGRGDTRTSSLNYKYAGSLPQPCIQDMIIISVTGPAYPLLCFNQHSRYDCSLWGAGTSSVGLGNCGWSQGVLGRERAPEAQMC